MPIKSLESFLFERKLVNTSSIELLQNASIGIDVDHYLNRIYTFKKEQFLSGIGGIPSSLKDYISSDLQVFKEYNIRPIFVISGLGIQLQQARYSTNELTPQEQHIKNTWSKLNSKSLNPYGYNALNNESFRLFTDPLPLRPMINDLVKYFIENNIDYLISPYDSSFQLSCLYHENIIDSIYGSTDLLLTKVDKYILGMEFQSKDFRYIDKNRILHELNLTDRQFKDISLLVGCNVQPTTFPNLPPFAKPIQPYAQLGYFKIYLEYLYQCNFMTPGGLPDFFGYVVSLNDPNLLELYLKGHSALQYMPVMNVYGQVELYSNELARLGIANDYGGLDIQEKNNKEPDSFSPAESNKSGENQQETSKLKIKIPNDIHDFISQRLPPELYFYQSLGLLDLELLEAITQGHMNVRPPLEGGMCSNYKQLITLPYFVNQVDLQFTLITQLLARYYQVKKISMRYWFKDQEVELNNRMTPPLYQRLSHLVSCEEKSGDDFSLIKFFKKLPESFNTEPISTKKVSSNEDIISTVLLRNLYMLQIIDNKTNRLTSLGHIIKRFVSECGNEISESEIQELVLLLLLLIRPKIFRLDIPSKEYNGVPKFLKEFKNEEIKLSQEDINSITLISRVFSMHKFDISPINYQGPISRALMNFRSLIKFILRCLNNNLSNLLVDFVVHQEGSTVKLKHEDRSGWQSLIKGLPFYKDCNNTLLGVVAEIYFEYSIKQKIVSPEITKDEINRKTQSHLLNTVFQINNSSFNINVNGINSITAEQLLRDFGEGVKFWSHFVKLAEIVHEEDKNLLDDEYISSIKTADKVLYSIV